MNKAWEVGVKGGGLEVHITFTVGFVLGMQKLQLLSYSNHIPQVRSLFLGSHCLDNIYDLVFAFENDHIFSLSRLVYVAARDGLMPPLLAMIHVKRFTPFPSLFFTVSGKMFLLIFAAKTTQTMLLQYWTEET